MLDILDIRDILHIILALKWLLNDLSGTCSVLMVSTRRQGCLASVWRLVHSCQVSPQALACLGGSSALRRRYHQSLPSLPLQQHLGRGGPASTKGCLPGQGWCLVPLTQSGGDTGALGMREVGHLGPQVTPVTIGPLLLAT